jgi:hypothetical protein
MRMLALSCCAVALLGGCAGGNPQTRVEFQEMTSHSSLGFVESYVAKRRFEDVMKSLTQKAEQCLQYNLTTTREQGGIRTMNQTDEIRTTIRAVSKDRAEMTIQMTMKGAIVVQQVPPGGFYNGALDIERLTPATTKLTYYGSALSAGKKRWAALQQWGDGQPAPCP